MNVTTVTLEKRHFSSNVVDKFHKCHDRRYSRINCGIGWPSENQPGALVVVGEELVINPVFVPKLYWFGEYETHSISELLDRALFFKSDLLIDAFFGMKGQEGYIRFRNQAAQKERLPETHIWQATQQDEGMAYYLALIADLSRIENPRLMLGHQSRLPGVLGQLPASVAGLKLEDYPLLAALGFAVDPLARMPYQAVNYGGTPNRCETKYELFPSKQRR